MTRKKTDPCLLALYLKDFNGLTRREKAYFWWYASILCIALGAILLAHHHCGPSLGQIMGW